MSKTIQLTQGKVALVDDADYDALSAFTWHARRNKDRFYASRTIRFTSTWKTVPMHRELLPGASMVDHKDGDGLNNQRENLRAATNAQNTRNRGVGKNSTSGFKGVYPSRRKSKPWRAEIRHEEIYKSLGNFPTPEEAARAYDKAALEHHGEFARLNFPTTMKTKKILVDIPTSTVTKLRRQARASGRSLTSQATHLVNIGAVTDRPIHLEVALKNITDHAVPCNGDKNHVVPTVHIRNARKLVSLK